MADEAGLTPGAAGRIGVLGGGQLGRMLGLAGLPLGFSFLFLDPSADACAGSVGDLIQAGFSDPEAARKLAAAVDVATFDFENVPEATARAIQSTCPLYPAANALGAGQDRSAEKALLTRLGIQVPPYHEVSSRTDLLEGLDRLGYPAILKTRRLGYDGKGQALLRDPEDRERAWQKLGDSDLVLEAFIPFEAECSLVAVRGQDGEIRAWPLTRNVHSNGILKLSLPGVFDQALQSMATGKMSALMEHLDYTGVLTIEFFLVGGELLVNEFAPRVHNSGHWTIDGASCSQFENHVRAIAGLPLGGTGMTEHSLMFNWIGEMPDRRRALQISGLHWHDYAKSPRPGRKIGHATLTAPSLEDLQAKAVDLARIAGGEFPALLETIFD
ncbi:MAG: 5-(carboxyamino)imidazole ribonucleotide synthase [Xanthomonadales bacterium]|nr:5-(carboxyamino)imidazole ribonucleotide synthase [Gammaproteobacteria bacterium]MBT8053302.1 5-(carboxyamino)imidazole ribonucleotide synthase [Gammaproteobacteria bacterium]NND58014.1 5-(carboxyamino)imidazole ribonucleotide synthase [Xanthomonadales bacterium]NNK52111.1 5-(carboxyamino)imidazole ribonucleotide synthase [Xanthomonadales bacterium]